MKIKYLPKPSRIFLLQWHITDRCNWNCKHCYQKGEYLENEAGIEDLIHILDNFTNALKIWGIRGLINITGGEPFIRNDFFQLLEKIYERRDVIERIGILTNGSLITKQIAKRLKDFEVQMVQVSLEGMKNINDKIRGKDSFEKIINSAKILVDEGIPEVVISFTSNKRNFKDFHKVVELGRKIGVNRVWTDRLVPYGHGKGLEKDMLEPMEVKEFYESINKISKQLKENGGTTQVPTTRSLYFLAGSEHHYICPAADRSIVCMPNGDVFPCRRMPIIVGNLLKQDFFEIWYGNEILWKLRDRNEINSLCRKCKHFEECLGGARCISYGYCDNPFVPDPQCWIAFNKLPTQEELLLYKNKKNDNGFEPRFKMFYSKLMGAKPYLQSIENSILYVSESVQLLNENQYLKINIEDIQKLAENIVGKKPDFILISIQISENSINKRKYGKEIIHFLQNLINNKINFKLVKPLPRCLFDSEYQKIIQKFKIPISCKDCLELFRLNVNNKIKLCTGMNGPEIKYINDRNHIYEYSNLFYNKVEISRKCEDCTWFVREQCHGLCNHET